MHPQFYIIPKDIHVSHQSVGFSNCGFLKRTRVLHPVAPRGFLLQKNIPKDAAIEMELLVSKVPTNPTSSWAESCEQDIKRGVASDLFENGLDGRRGNSRAITNGAIFGLASGAEYSETLDLCTAVQRVLHARELVKSLDTLGVPQSAATTHHPYTDGHPFGQKSSSSTWWLYGSLVARVVLASLLVHTGGHHLQSFSNACLPADGSGFSPTCIFTT